VGALYVRSGVELEIFIHGGGQEAGARAGTENVLEIVGLGKACEIAKRDLVKNTMHMAERRAQLLGGLRQLRSDVEINGHPDNGLPNTLNISFPGVRSATLIEKVSDSLALSAGSACHSGEESISAVLAAMGLEPNRAHGALRFSTGRQLSKEQVAKAIDVLSVALST